MSTIIKDIEAIDLLLDTKYDKQLKEIYTKIINSIRISEQEALTVYKESSLNTLGILANLIRVRKHGKNTYFNRNIHVEPTNICTYKCKFCSYARTKGDIDAWEYSIDEILSQIALYANQITEIHIVGGVHPERDLDFYVNLLSKVREKYPDIHIKAFTAVELDYMAKKSGLSVAEAILKLKNVGLDSIPGGGAEIFNDEIRKVICGSKSNAGKWLEIHEAAHKNGVMSNATMLYGHIETIADRINHLSILRNLQDRTNGFNAFIPLKYKNSNNELSHIDEVTIIEDLKLFAISRIFLDNISHLKAYWPMLGKENALLALDFGADDFDGTILDTTKIYSMAGSKEERPSLLVDEMVTLLKSANKIPVERDSLYNKIREM
ncbi:MAG: aminofutalosine synthase MqnE [Bacteroidales bacterium]|nr:aminofutalosine synthase MqnE [Bacteroidales bacterium]